MKYLTGSFTVGGTTEAYRDGWERTFGRTDDAPDLSEVTCSRCETVIYLIPPLRSPADRDGFLCSSCEWVTP